jgi:hypothetical protein
MCDVDSLDHVTPSDIERCVILIYEKVQDIRQEIIYFKVKSGFYGRLMVWLYLRTVRDSSQSNFFGWKTALSFMNNT